MPGKIKETEQQIEVTDISHILLIATWNTYLTQLKNMQPYLDFKFIKGYSPKFAERRTEQGYLLKTVWNFEIWKMSSFKLSGPSPCFCLNAWCFAEAYLRFKIEFHFVIALLELEMRKMIWERIFDRLKYEMVYRVGILFYFSCNGQRYFVKYGGWKQHFIHSNDPRLAARNGALIVMYFMVCLFILISYFTLACDFNNKLQHSYFIVCFALIFLISFPGLPICIRHQFLCHPIQAFGLGRSYLKAGNFLCILFLAYILNCDKKKILFSIVHLPLILFFVQLVMFTCL